MKALFYVQRSPKTSQTTGDRSVSVSQEKLLTSELLQSVWTVCRHSLPLMYDQKKL